MKKRVKVLALFISLVMVVGFVLPMVGPVTVSAAAITHNVGNTTDLDTLVTGGTLEGETLSSGDTINITASFEHNKTISLNLDEVTLNLGTFTLTLKTSTEAEMLELEDTLLKITGTGSLIIDSSTAAGNGIVMEGVSTISNAGATLTVNATGASINVLDEEAVITSTTPINIGPGPISVGGGAELVLTASIVSTGTGIIATGAGTDVEVTGNITAAGALSNAVLATSGAKINVKGNLVLPGTSPAISATGAGTEITVEGNVGNNIFASNSAKVSVKGTLSAFIIADSGAIVTLEGNVAVTSGTGIGVSANGANTSVTVTGNINLTGTFTGVQAWNGAAVVLAGTGNINVNGSSTNIGVHLGTGSGTVGTSRVTVNGVINAPNYILFENGTVRAFRPADDYDDVVTVGTVVYRQFDDVPGVVQVRAGTVVTNIKGNGTVDISATQIGNTVTLELDNPKISELITTATGANPVRIDLSPVTATTVSITPDLFSQVNGSNKTLRIDMPQGSILFSAGALTTLGGRTANIEISLHVQNVSTLPAAQRNAINATDVVYSVTATSGGVAITSFAGSLTITLNYSGPFPAEVILVSITGVTTRLTSTASQVNRTMTFSRNSLSIFIIRATTTTTPNPNVPQTSDDVSVLMLGLVALAAIGGLITLLIIKKRHFADRK